MSTKDTEDNDQNDQISNNIEADTATSSLEILPKLRLSSEEFTKQKIIHIKIKKADGIDKKLNETSIDGYFHTQICDIFGDIELTFCEQFLISEIIEHRNGKFCTFGINPVRNIMN